MAELRLLDAAEAAAGLRSAAAGARGFLGLDPVTDNDPLLIRELTKLDAQVYQGGDTLLGYLPHPEQPRQAVVATTSADAEPLRALLAFLGTYQRCTSYLAMVPDGAAAATAFEQCGFNRVGTLRDHCFQSGRYLDVHVFHAEQSGTASREDACLS